MERETLGRRLQALRAAAGLSQERLAERLDVARQTVSKWELDQSTPELGKLLELSELYGVSLDQLVRGGEFPINTPDLERLARENRRSQRRTALTVVGSLCLLLGVFMAACLVVLDNYMRHLHYLLYRYMTVGEYQFTPVSLQVPMFLTTALCGLGAALLTTLLLRKH